MIYYIHNSGCLFITCDNTLINASYFKETAIGDMQIKLVPASFPMWNES